jgi:hypothetical protein
MDTSSRSGTTYTFRRSFYYRSQAPSANELAEAVRRVFPAATAVEAGDHEAPFRGGASVRAGSHVWVRFTLPDN